MLRKLTKKEKAIVKQIIKFIKRKHISFENHDYSHVFKVTRYAIRIGKSMKKEIDPFILICSCLFHDIGRTINIPTLQGLHGIQGANLANEYLDVIDIKEDIREKIRNAIFTHSITSIIKPKSTEAKILFDADAIDRLGYIGILRGIMLKRGSLSDILKKLVEKRSIVYSSLHFTVSKKIAQKAHKKTISILKELKKAIKKRAIETSDENMEKLLEQL